MCCSLLSVQCAGGQELLACQELLFSIVVVLWAQECQQSQVIMGCPLCGLYLSRLWQGSWRLRGRACILASGRQRENDVSTPACGLQHCSRRVPSLRENVGLGHECENTVTACPCQSQPESSHLRSLASAKWLVSAAVITLPE